VAINLSANLKKIAVVGVGNVLFTDEGIGVYAAKYLEENYTFSDNVDIIDGGVLGFRLMPFFQDYDYVLLLDTVSIEDEAGSIYKLPKEAMLGLGSYRKTAHEVEIVEMLEICTFLDKCAEVTVVGIIPLDIETVECNLTPSILNNYNAYIKTILDELTLIGASFSKQESYQPIKTVVSDFFEENNKARIHA
jgi:hydrogenase maturation protease